SDDPPAHRRLYFEHAAASTAATYAGARIDTSDPLAVLAHGKEAPPSPQTAASPDLGTAVAAPLQGTIVAVDVTEGDTVRSGQQLPIMVAMKMEHVVSADRSCGIRGLCD